MELTEVMSHFAVPRPDQSEALNATAAYIKTLLSSWGVPFTVQEFGLHPYMQLILGVTMFLLAILLFVLVLKRRPIAALIVALLIPALLIVEFELFIPIVTGIIERTGQNIIVTFTVPHPARELIFAAHYDSKTDIWDHIQRARVYRFIPLAVALGIVLAIFCFFTRRFAALKKGVARAITLLLTGAVVVYWGLVAYGFGGYIFVPVDRQSHGAVDDGGSVVTLLLLAKDIQDGKISLGNSNITIVFTAGEEVTLQGSNRYVEERFGRGTPPALPTSLVDLELVGQNGTMIYWEKDGVFLKYYDADPERFMAAGIPAITVGNSGIPGLGEAGFHSAADNIDRVNFENLQMMIRTLELYVEFYLTK
jgi:acetylornithine deacetylase/succinyl-diaminopimelate desuccinylase-like protein